MGQKKWRLPMWLSVGELGKERLQAERFTFDSRLRLRKAASARSDNDWMSVATELVKDAGDAADRGRTQEGWECLQEAQRLEAFGMNKTELADRTLLNEAQDKVKSDWRKRSITEMLTPKKGANGQPSEDPPEPETIYHANRLLDEDRQNDYRKLRLRRSQVYLLFAYVVVVLTALGATVTAKWIGTNDVLSDSKTFLTVALLGALGGALSALTRRSRDNADGLSVELRRRRGVPDHIVGAAISVGQRHQAHLRTVVPERRWSVRRHD